MKIDAHQHFWRYSPEEYAWITDDMTALKRDCLPENLHGPLLDNGFDACVAVQARQSETETDFLLQLSENAPFVKAVVGWVALQEGGLESRLEHYTRFKKLKGFRHIVQDEPDDNFILNKPFIRGVQLLGAFGFTYDILVYERQLPAVVRFLGHFDESQPFVLDHIGKPDIKRGMSQRWKDSIQEAARHPNLYCKISGLVTEADWHNWKAEDCYPYLEHVLNVFGTERLMVGSDWPVCLLAADSYHQVIQLAEGFFSGLEESEKAMVFGANAARFYNIQ